MTIAFDWDVKPQTENKGIQINSFTLLMNHFHLASFSVDGLKALEGTLK